MTHLFSQVCSAVSTRRPGWASPAPPRPHHPTRLRMLVHDGGRLSEHALNTSTTPPHAELLQGATLHRRECAPHISDIAGAGAADNRLRRSHEHHDLAMGGIPVAAWGGDAVERPQVTLCQSRDTANLALPSWQDTKILTPTDPDGQGARAGLRCRGDEQTSCRSAQTLDSFAQQSLAHLLVLRGSYFRPEQEAEDNTGCCHPHLTKQTTASSDARCEVGLGLATRHLSCLEGTRDLYGR